MDKTKKIAVIALAILLLSASAIVYYPIYVQSYQATHKPLIMIEAEKLAEKPANYTQLENPDPYVLEAISQEKIVAVAEDDTQIDNIIGERGINKFEINGNYYTIYVGFVGVDFPLSDVVLISFVALPLSAIVLILTLTVILIRKRKR